MLAEFAQTMVADAPIEHILERMVGRIVEVMPVTAAGVTLIASDRQPRYIAGSDSLALRYEKLQTQVSDAPCLAAFETGTAISVPDLAADHRFPEFAPRALSAGLAAVFTFPLRHAAIRIGALDLYRDSPGTLAAGSMTAVQTLADVTAAYLINAQRRADLQDALAQSRDAALHDPLTGLPNRLLMLELVEHAMRASRRSGGTSAVLFIDLDRFKEVNDTYGHQIGDQLLIAAGERVSAVLRPGDSVGRRSGDEFLVLCEQLDDPSQADLIASRLRQELSRPFIVSGVTVAMTASIGVAFTGHGSDDPEALLRDADLAMYRNKRAEAESFEISDLRTPRRSRPVSLDPRAEHS